MSEPPPDAREVAIIASGGANTASLQFALQRLGAASLVSADAAQIRAASHIILPGVGAAADAMSRLRRQGLDTVIPSLRQPVLGVCLGMQLLFEASEEGHAQCLGIIPGLAARFIEAPGHPALGRDLADFMDVLGLERAVLAGYDWGGRAACVVAALWPQRATALVTVGGYNIQNIGIFLWSLNAYSISKDQAAISPVDSHCLRFSCAPSPAKRRQSRVRRPQVQKQGQTQEPLNFNVNYRSGGIARDDASNNTNRKRKVDAARKGAPAAPKVISKHHPTSED